MTSETGIAQQRARTESKRDLFSPWIDFLCLGGASLVILPLLLLVPHEHSGKALLISLLLANVINHPHFAHSYQIFYKDFGSKIRGEGIPRDLQRRYIFSGIAVPVLLALFFATCILQQNPRLLGAGFNIMLFTVGWHYVKQGYGMLIVDSVYKKLYFSAQAKKVFLWNAYSAWIFYWLCANRFMAGIKDDYWGISYALIDIPEPLLILSCAATILTATLSVIELLRTYRTHGTLPMTGVTAYLASLHVWLFMRFAPTAMMFVPAFHSLQYLAVVYRYQLNAGEAPPVAGGVTQNPRRRFALFVLSGILLGAAGFWFAPYLLDKTVPYDRNLFGGTLFIFVFWIFINVHHYFLDNVMWRKENPATKKYLFG